MKPLWHRIGKERFEHLKSGGMTWGEAREKFRQPDWCTYPDAINGVAGCWSLTGPKRQQISKSFCANCECFSDEAKGK